MGKTPNAAPARPPAPQPRIEATDDELVDAQPTGQLKSKDLLGIEQRTHMLDLEGQGTHALQLSSVNGNWLKKRLLDNPQVLDHEQIAGGFLVTASPKELQTFLKKHNDTPNAFSQVSKLRRRSPNP